MAKETDQKNLRTGTALNRQYCVNTQSSCHISAGTRFGIYLNEEKSDLEIYCAEHVKEKWLMDIKTHDKTVV